MYEIKNTSRYIAEICQIGLKLLIFGTDLQGKDDKGDFFTSYFYLHAHLPASVLDSNTVESW